MAVVLHPARATRDWLPAGVPRGGRMYHVLSDIIGPEGGQELRAFVAQCGIRPRWAQYPGTYREHFDAPPDAVGCLLAHGARLVTTHELGHLLRAKRAASAPPDPSDPHNTPHDAP